MNECNVHPIDEDDEVEPPDGAGEGDEGVGQRETEDELKHQEESETGETAE